MNWRTIFSWRGGGRRRRYIIHFALAVFVLGLSALGALAPLDRSILEFRFQQLPRDASGSLVVVEIDARSIHGLDVWPWPRRHHAALIDILVESGAEAIALDIDLSARSSRSDDELLAEAIRRARSRVILATFIQSADSVRRDALLENLPQPLLRSGASLATVNVHPEGDGRIWRSLTADLLPSGYRPSLPVLLAGTGLYAGIDFSIDYGIRENTIPRVSFIDVLEGRVGAEMFRGRKVIVGSTAAELGDYLNVPVYGNLPGVIVQALAYESIVQGRALQRTGLPATILGVLAMFLIVLPAMVARDSSWRRAAAIAGAACVAITGFFLLLQSQFPLVVDTAAWLVAVVCWLAAIVVRSLEAQALLLFRQRMAGVHRRALMRAVVEDNFAGIIIANDEGQIELANLAAAQLLGRDATDLVGRSVEDAFSANPALDIGRDLAVGQSREIELHRAPDGNVSIEMIVSESVLRLSKSPQERRRRERRVRIYTFRDISVRKTAEESQRRAFEETISASRAKSEFLANMSHELRTPLNAIIGFSEVMAGQYMGPLGHPKYHDYAADIRNAAGNLLKIIEQVLDVSKIEVGTLQINENIVHVAETVLDCERIIQGWLAEAPRKLIKSVASGSLALSADNRMLKQIILNLISNAIKFTREDGTIWLRVALNGAGDLVIEIEDDGVGIPDNRLAGLAVPFFQIDGSLTRSFGGTGLGLYLVKRFLALHGGRLEIESTEDIGTKVRAVFPAARVASPPEHPATGGDVSHPTGDRGQF
jgi:PAS domain S-box-containing protein